MSINKKETLSLCLQPPKGFPLTLLPSQVHVKFSFLLRLQSSSSMNRDERKKKDSIKEGEWDRIESGRREKGKGILGVGRSMGERRRDKRRPATSTESQELIKGVRQKHCWDKKERTGRLKGT